MIVEKADNHSEHSEHSEKPKTFLWFFAVLAVSPWFELRFKPHLRCLTIALFSATVALPAFAAFDVAQLMNDLAQHKGGRAKFVEKKYIALLDKPVIATGEMNYIAPDRLEKRTLTPKPELLILDKDTLTLEREKQKLTINLANQPEALAFVDSIRGTLSGNRAALEKNYLLHLAGSAEKWELTLLPSDQKIATLIQRITVAGRKNQIVSIEYLQADGDRSVLLITPISIPTEKK